VISADLHIDIANQVDVIASLLSITTTPQNKQVKPSLKAKYCPRVSCRQKRT